MSNSWKREALLSLRACEWPRWRTAKVFLRCFSSIASKDTPVLDIPSATIFRFSALGVNKRVLDLNWIINRGESWAIIGNAGEEKLTLLETLKGQSSIHPPPPKGVWPFLLEQNLDPIEHVRSVSFAHRPRAVTGGGFYDYSARYGAVREEDRVTLRQYFLNSVHGGENSIEDMVIHLAGSLELKQYLDLPLVALSNGQTRRARIVKALLQKPKVLLLDEPLTGLDVHHRPRLISLLEALHKTSAPHIIMSLRRQDPVPDWISHVAFVRPGGQVVTGPKAGVLLGLEEYLTDDNQRAPMTNLLHQNPKAYESQGAVLVDLQDVNVSYHERHILKNITWSIREGDRWLLRGANGSGKTTLLSIITGDHPQSYVQNHLQLFGVPRRRMATPEISRRIGISSPELFNAFPRRSGPQGLTVRDAIATGFDGIFTYRKHTSEQTARIDTLLQDLGPAAWMENPELSATAEFGKKLFADLTPGEQSLVMLLRAIVTEPKLLILDEAFSGMDERMVKVVTKHLKERIGERQSIIWVSHWDAEAPWGAKDAVKKFTLERGHGKITQDF